MRKRYFALIITCVILCNIIVCPIHAEDSEVFPNLMKYYSNDIIYKYADVFGYDPISTLSNDEYLYDTVYYDGYYIVLPYVIEWETTPNGSSVPLVYYLEDIPEAWKNGMENDNFRDYGLRPDLVATRKYNCHSFAWCDESCSNDYWLENPSIYYDTTDRSYVEITSGIRPGDIICYINYYGDNIHSGIVTDVSDNSLNNDYENLELIGVQSKWGTTGLYTHRGDHCPYTDTNPQYDLIGEEYRKELFAYSVKFYRPRTNMEIDLNANMSLRNSSISLSNTGEITDRYYMYELNVEASGMYDIYVNPDISLNERFYDENMNLLSYSAYYPNSTFAHHYYANLAQGRYYFRVENVNASESTDARITFLSHDSHNYQYTNINDNNHTASCTCGHTEISDHAYEYKQISDFYHILKCDCGKTSGIQEGHIYTGSGLIGYVKCIQCGFLKYVGNTTIPIIKGKIPTIEAICKE